MRKNGGYGGRNPTAPVPGKASEVATGGQRDPDRNRMAERPQPM